MSCETHTHPHSNRSDHHTCRSSWFSFNFRFFCGGRRKRAERSASPEVWATECPCQESCPREHRSLCFALAGVRTREGLTKSYHPETVNECTVCVCVCCVSNIGVDMRACVCVCISKTTVEQSSCFLCSMWGCTRVEEKHRVEQILCSMGLLSAGH